MKRRFVLGALAVSIAFGSAGCLTPAQRREDALVRMARDLNDDLRWGRWSAVAQVLPPEEARGFLSRANAIGEELVMADYEVTAIDFGTPSDTATSQVKLDWYTQREPTVKKTTIEQRWKYKGGTWVLIEQRRTKGERFPLLLEPEPKAEGKEQRAGGK